MNTLTPNTSAKEKRTLFHANPVLSRLSKVDERAETNAATYSGIFAKTAFFLLLTLVGMLIQLLVKNALSSQPVWQTVNIKDTFSFTLGKTETIILAIVFVVGFVSELLGLFVRKTVPVTGSIYALSQGYVISFLVFTVLKGYEYLGLEALLLTVAVVAVMSCLYSFGIIKGGKKFYTVLFTLIIGSVLVALFGLIGSLIPATRPYVQEMLNNSGFVIAIDVIGIIIAALFLISDFVLIDTCVREGYPKEYEWSAAFGLVFTVIWLYLKILDLLMQLTNKSKD